MVYKNPFDFKESKQFKNKWEEYTYGNWKRGTGKTYVTLETVIPEIPKKIGAPDEAAFHKTLAEVDQKIKNLTGEMTDQKAKFTDTLEQKKSNFNPGEKVPINMDGKNRNARVRHLKDQKQKIYNESNKYEEEKTELTRKRDQYMKKIDRKYQTEE